MNSRGARLHAIAAAACLAFALAVLAACGNPPPVLADSSATRLIVVGDFGTGDFTETAVATAIRYEHDSDAIDGLVTTGDNIYPDGGPEYFDEAWRQPYGWTQTEKVRVIASLGNHDVQRNAGPVMRLLGMPARWYRTEVGPVEIIVLDSTVVSSSEQRAFLERELSVSSPPDVKYRIVVMHHPPYSCSKHKNTKSVLRSWGPLIKDSDVDLVLSGHDHVYERFAPVSGTIHIVSGGGGYSLHEVGTCPAGTPQLMAQGEDFHYLLIEATAEQMRVQATALDGRELDMIIVQGSS